MPISILYQKELAEYDFGLGHPFRSDRFEMFLQFLRENLPEDDNYRILKAERAEEEDLSLICQKDYIDFTNNYYRAANLGLSYDQRFYRYHSSDNIPGRKPGKLEEAARLIIGQAKMACHLVQENRFQKVVSLGGGLHHAKQNYGEGFCIYNDVAFVGKYLMEKYKLERILILDTDAHCGNGTMEYFYEEPRILFIDVHQDPRTLYPGTGFSNQIGQGKGRGLTINVPLPMFAGDNSYKLVFEEIVEPMAKEFNPQIIIRNGGSDPHFADGLTQLGLTLKGFQMIGEKVRNLANLCEGKVIDLIGSGYNEKVLPYGWLTLISGLADIKIKIDEPIPVPQKLWKDSSLKETKKVIQEVKTNLKN